MKAIAYYSHGEPDQLKLIDLPMPSLGKGEVLVKVAGVGLNPADLKRMRGLFSSPLTFPYVPGSEFSGKVESVGAGVAGYEPGDEVYGVANNALAEYVCVATSSLSKAPSSLDLPTAGVVPVAGLTAWQFLHDQAEVKAGDRVLIHAAAGGVGTFAVQFAKLAGAYVIGTAGPENHHYLERLGADQVINYRAVKFEDEAKDVDIVIDLVGGETTIRSLKVMKPGAVLIGANGKFDFSPFEAEGKRAKAWSMEPNHHQLEHIRDMIEDVQISVIVSDQAPLERAREAFELLATGHVKGKLLITVG